jgi:putrescine aminotransferase
VSPSLALVGYCCDDFSALAADGRIARYLGRARLPAFRWEQAMSALISLEAAEELSVEQVHDLYRRYVSCSQVNLMTSFGFGRELVERAEGPWVYMRDGTRVLDFSGGVGVLNHGHNHPRILAARQRFAQARRMEVHKAFFSPYLAALSHNLAALLPGDLTMSYFPNSGAEANEGAIKMAYKYHSGTRDTILRADISFHGKTLGAGSLTGSSENHFRFPGLPGAVVYPYGDIAAVRAAVQSARTARGGCDVYAILVEPFSASSLRCWSEQSLRELRELCSAEDIVLIFDEVYTGWGKAGSLFYFMRFEGLLPDIVTYSKSLGGGKASISGYTAREPIFRRAYDRLSDVILHSTTYYGFGEETATAIEAINAVVEEDYPGRAREIERLLAPGLERIRKTYPDIVARVEGVGALHGLFLSGGPKILSLAGRVVPGFSGDPQFGTKLVALSVIAHLFREHRVMTYYSPNVDNPVMAAPSLTVGPEEVEHFLDALDATLAKGIGRLLSAFVREKVGSRW